MSAIISQICHEDAGTHAKITVWNRSGLAGTLTVRRDDAEEVIDRLRTRETRCRRSADEKNEQLRARLCKAIQDELISYVPVALLDLATPAVVDAVLDVLQQEGGQ